MVLFRTVSTLSKLRSRVVQQPSLNSTVRWLQIQTSSDLDLQSQLRELIPEQQERLKKLKTEHGKVQLGNITVDMVPSKDQVDALSKELRVRATVPEFMAGNSLGKAVKSVAKAVGEYQYPWREKLAKHKHDLCRGVWGYWELGAWKPLSISARQRARLRKEVLLAGEDWPYDPERKPEKTKRKGHKCDRISAEKKDKTKELMQKMPEMLLDYKKRRWAKKMKEEDARK